MINRYLIGIDIGGTNTKVGIVDTDGKIVEKTSVATQPDNGALALVERVYSCCQNLLDKASIKWEDLIAAGIGSPGILDLQKGLILLAPNLKDWIDVPIVKIFQEKLKKKCILENDANAAAWGERWVGVGNGKKIDALVMVTLGTGIGGGIILEDKIWHGCFNVAGELGHITIEANGRKCSCGNYGCVEAYASATSVAVRYKEASNIEADVTAKDVYNAALDGNEIAREIMAETGRYIGICVVNIMHTLNPDIIVIGGGMSAARDLLIHPMREEIKKRSYRFASKYTNVIFGKLGNNAGLIGAAGWALKTLETSV
ncbi:MAG: ROK family protein [Candidatus Anammoxibacter sp.]